MSLTLKVNAALPALLPADGKDLAADLPDMRTAPLDHGRGRGKRAAEFIEFTAGHTPDVSLY